MIEKTELQSRKDLLRLMQVFYKKLLADDSISYFFTDIAKINLDHHLTVLVDFWDSVLFQTDTYHKNAMHPHIVLHQKSPLKKSHFETWLGYFKSSVDELFTGDNAFKIKEKATSIATVMQIKTIQVTK